jgi:6-pyruvoyltetrahydropterin/6-carboxytetrahydropterin synthase
VPKIFELTQEFYFEAAHTLERQVDTESSRRVHGHTYHAAVTIRGCPDTVSGMVLDLGVFRARLADVREQLDHHLLNELPDLGPPTLENLCQFIWRRLAADLPGLSEVAVSRRASGDRCSLKADA